MSSQPTPYPESLAKCMLHYQFIEESLRFCLYRCQTLIQLSLLEVTPYEVHLKKIDEAALACLIEQFKPYTRNEALIQKLRLINNHRDSLAHEGLMLSVAASADKTLPQQSPELKAFLLEAEACAEMLREETARIDYLVRQEYANYQGKPALAEIEIIPPL